ncbi:MAG: hypothetical protein ACD_39C00309G0001 [uncultured bacterium]|nr:MAG: hypothetical protein ACD_39C00309G0001 [uncultured bacterium]
MREVKAKPFRRNHRTGLFDMVTKNLAQSFMQEMRGGMVAHGGSPTAHIDLHLHRGAFGKSLRALPAADMHIHAFC